MRTSSQVQNVWRLNESENRAETIWRGLRIRAIRDSDLAQRARNQVDEGFYRIKCLRRPKN